MHRYEPPDWAQLLHRVAWRIIRRSRPAGAAGADGGGRLPLNAAIDLHKAATGAFVLALMYGFDVFTTSAWVYLALHGTYGLAWVVKDLAVGDKAWRRRVGPLGVLGVWAFLTLYWVAPAILILGQAGAIDLGDWSPAGPTGLAVAVTAYVIGLVVMIGSDAQKNVALRSRGPAATVADDATVPAAGEADRGPVAAAGAGPGLVRTGFFARSRHPNYLGEMMIYGAFALVVGHWLPWLILAAIWGLFFLPNILAIEASVSRYPEYEDWRRRTGLLLPRLRS